MLSEEKKKMIHKEIEKLEQCDNLNYNIIDKLAKLYIVKEHCCAEGSSMTPQSSPSAMSMPK